MRHITLKIITVLTTLSQSENALSLGSKKPAPEPSNPSPPSLPSHPPTPVTPPSNSFNAVNDIAAIAQNSTCKNFAWANRGRAPAAYMSGMAITFAKSLCRLKQSESATNLMAVKNTQNSNKDALSWYESIFDAKQIEIDSSGAETLRSLYTLGIGLGMRETSGRYCTGRDTTASNPTAVTAEAGLFQTSYNSMSASSELKKLYSEYNSGNFKCHLDVFSKNVSCAPQDTVGTGAGADFQRKLKSCPALATEYAMITLRVLRKHYGPINRREAELNSSCNEMLSDVQSYIDRNAINACDQL